MDRNIETRLRVHAFVDQLPPTQLAAIEGLLRSMLDSSPATEAHRAEEIEEFLRPTWEDEALSEEGEEGPTFEQVVAECGLPTDQIRKSPGDRQVKKIRFEPNAPTE